MWKFSKEDEKKAVPPKSVTPVATSPAAVSQPVSVQKTPAATPKEAYPVETKPAPSYRPEVAHIGKNVVVKGELTGSEDLYLDGEIEGNIELHEHSIIIGPNGKIRANVRAREIIVHGKVDGNLYGNEKVELKKSAVLVGDVFTQRVAIEDGAYFKGGIDIQKVESKTPAVESKPLAAEPKASEPKVAVASASPAPSVSTTSTT